MTPGAIKAWLIGLLLLFVVAGGAAVAFLYDHNAKEAEAAKALRKELDGYKGALADQQAATAALDARFTEKLRSESAIRDNRATKAHQFETLKHEDQAVADWADQPVPQRVRQLDATGTPPELR